MNAVNMTRVGDKNNRALRKSPFLYFFITAIFLLDLNIYFFLTDSKSLFDLSAASFNDFLTS